MKKLWAVLLCFVLLFAMTACGNSAPAASEEINETNITTKGQVPMWSTYGQLSREVRGCCIQVGQPSWVWWVYMERKAHFNRASLNFIHKALVTLFS